MPGCVAKYCKNMSTQGIKMCCFPKETELRTVWVNNMRRSNWQPKKDSRLCEVHFDDDQWEKVRVDGTKKLKWKAVPTIFGQAARYRTEKIKNNRSQQRQTIQEKSLSTSIESTNQINTNIVKISEQNNNMGKKCENEKTELMLNRPRTIHEYQQRLERLEMKWKSVYCKRNKAEGTKQKRNDENTNKTEETIGSTNDEICESYE